MKLRALIFALLLFGNLIASTLPTPTYKNLPEWHGFNLTEMLHQEQREKFREWDFKMIHELGFNFVRIPLDYRCWIVDGDWEKIDEEALKDIDEAIGFGRKYDIHISINLHRAPGFTVASPAEPRSLWKDPEAQRVCRLHWQMFARRYKDVDPKYLSFNLFNEPNGVSEEDYAKVVKMMVDVIHAENPDRVIIADGKDWAYNPAKTLYDLPVAQATRGYQPMFITHYRAEWANGERFPTPVWPFPDANAWFAGSEFAGGDVKEAMTPLEINLDLEKPAKFRLKVGRVSQHIELHAILDGKEIWQKEYTPGKGKQVVYNDNIVLDLPPNAKQLVIKASKGDFCNVLELGVAPENEKEALLITQSEYRSKNFPLHFKKNAWMISFNGEAWLWQKYFAKWADAKAHTGVIVGEFGCYNKTPHAVVLAWMEDNLKCWKKAQIGWALWKWRGPFGVLDSGREDVEYEDFYGHKLDRKMLDLLLKYK